MRTLKYREAVSEGTVLAMEQDPTVFVLGVGVDDPKGIFNTTLEAFKRFGHDRVFDTPLSEAALTGVITGAAIAGMRPVLVHARNDFLLVTLDQLVNNAAKWSYMSGGTVKAPLTIRAIIGRGWGQAAQHSQSLQATLSHFPGVKVVMPATAHDAKGLIHSAILDDAPVVVLEHRWLHEQSGPVPEGTYSVPIGSAAVVRPGTDVTIVAASLMVSEAVKAATTLAESGIDAEIVDVRTISPLDTTSILTSAAKTQRVVVADTGWRAFGLAAEISALVHEALFDVLRAPVRRIALPPVPTPCTPTLERAYYPGADEIVAAAVEAVERRAGVVEVAAGGRTGSDEKPFVGPF